MVIGISTQLGESADFPQNSDLPSSLHGESHGEITRSTIRIGSVFWSTTRAHAHALAAAHWDRYGFYEVSAKTYKSSFAPLLSISQHEKIGI